MTVFKVSESSMPELSVEVFSVSDARVKCVRVQCISVHRKPRKTPKRKEKWDFAEKKTFSA